MMEVALAGLFVLAIALGYLLGRWEKHRSNSRDTTTLAPEYFVGLNYLLNEQTDEAIETFIKALQINSETIETHIALGQLFCRRGEVDKAIHIHQQLLARPSLTREQNAQVLLELARDYNNAGLLDRAETLLSDVISSGTSQQWSARKELMMVYEKEKEWPKAIDVGKQLSGKGGDDISVRLSHYCCEQAARAIKQSDLKLARGLITQALGYDKSCVRASLLLGELEVRQDRPRDAIKALQRIHSQDARFVAESFPLLEQSYDRIGNLKGYSNWLLKCHKEAPSLGTVLSITQLLADKDSVKSASHFLVDQLQRWPSLKGLTTLIDLHLDITEGKNHRNLVLLKQLMAALVAEKPAYVCTECGFEGLELHWQCPGCGQWGSFIPVMS